MGKSLIESLVNKVQVCEGKLANEVLNMNEYFEVVEELAIVEKEWNSLMGSSITFDDYCLTEMGE